MCGRQDTVFGSGKFNPKTYQPMKLKPCKKPSGKLLAIDTPLNVRGQLFQTYRKDLPSGDCEHYEHNQTKDQWMKLERDME